MFAQLRLMLLVKSGTLRTIIVDQIASFYDAFISPHISEDSVVILVSLL